MILPKLKLFCHRGCTYPPACASSPRNQGINQSSISHSIHRKTSAPGLRPWRAATAASEPAPVIPSAARPRPCGRVGEVSSHYLSAPVPRPGPALAVARRRGARSLQQRRAATVACRQRASGRGGGHARLPKDGADRTRDRGWDAIPGKQDREEDGGISWQRCRRPSPLQFAMFVRCRTNPAPPR